MSEQTPPTEHAHPTEESETVEIYKEKQKTIRRVITYSVILIIGVLIIMYGGKLKFSKEGIEISKDLLASTDQKKENSKNGNFTVGELNDGAKTYIAENKNDISPAGFTGKNYINTSLGYLFSVDHPEKWNISYNQNNVAAGDISQHPVNLIDGGDGIIYKIGILNNTDNETIESVAGSIYNAFAAYAQQDPSLEPEITYDIPSQTAFFNGVNVQNYKRVLMKIVLQNEKGYFSYVEYPKEFEEDERVDEMKNMVATLTAI